MESLVHIQLLGTVKMQLYRNEPFDSPEGLTIRKLGRIVSLNLSDTPAIRNGPQRRKWRGDVMERALASGDSHNWKPKRRKHLVALCDGTSVNKLSWVTMIQVSKLFYHLSCHFLPSVKSVFFLL